MELCENMEADTFLEQKDRKHSWHPYTQVKTANSPIPIKKALGSLLYTYDGREIIDAISSWWVTLHGHSHPYIVKKIQKQLEEMEHVIFADFTHKPAVDLAEKLIALLPDGYSRVFYSDNGSTAVETAIKMALQYWYNQDSKTKKKRVIAFKGGYHGDTFGAMSVSSRELFTDPFAHTFFDVTFIDPPKKGEEQKTVDELEKILKSDTYACFIFEPVVQGAGGMRVHSSDGLNCCLEICRKHDVLTIADEVMTGFGRTGPNFAIERVTTTPDIVCLSKGLTGGFLPLGATVCKEELYNMFLSDQKEKAFLHGHSYCANPLGCVAGIASMELFDTDDCLQKRLKIEKQHKEFMHKYSSHPKVANIHVTGTIMCLEYQTQEETSYYHSQRDRLFSFFLRHNVLLRPLGNRVYVLPPYCIENEELNSVYQAIADSLEDKLWN